MPKGSKITATVGRLRNEMTYSNAETDGFNRTECTASLQ